MTLSRLRWVPNILHWGPVLIPFPLPSGAGGREARGEGPCRLEFRLLQEVIMVCRSGTALANGRE
jgi:hypothetical protein